MSSTSPSPAPRVPPELLAPAGDWDCARAAVENGADAVYFGLDTGFNARARATNISLDSLDELMGFLHRRGVKGYVTLNTLIFTSELAGVEEIVRRVARAGVDAVLIQDLGLVRLVREICPDLPIHASTQMTLTSAETIAMVQGLGVERVVLARELSIGEISQITRQSTMPLEVFVHGALCVAYSGQCMTSESLGGRSANRGQCAQACRLPYELVCDGKDVDLGDRQYLLSPQDLAAFDLVGELIAAGVCSFKIEGRLKTPEYVANITRHYRRAIDSAVEGQKAAFTPRQVEEMELSFSRGFSPGWLGGCDHKMLVPAISSAKRGVPLGRVQSVRGSRVAVELTASVKRGDGLVFEGNRAKNEEQGGRVFEVFVEGRSLTEPVDQGVVQLAFGHDALDVRLLRPGQQVWKTDDPELTSRLRKSFTGTQPNRRAPVDVSVVAEVGQPLVISARTDAGASCRIESPEPLAEARKHPLTEEVLAEQLGRLGGSAYELRACQAEITGNPMVPLSVLGELRHEMLRLLDESASRPADRRVAKDSVLPALRPPLAINDSAEPQPPKLHVLCRSLDQLRAALAHRVGSVMVDLQDIRQYADAVELAHGCGAEIAIATPRIQKPDEFGILRVLLRHSADAILVRNFAGLLFYAEQGVKVVADFSLNATNELTVEMLRRAGASRVTAAYDMNREQLLELVAATPPEWLEVVVHQHMPMFHMEHCVFCAVLSPGTNKHNCGRPCDTHQVRLRDRLGMEHTLSADVGCRNTLFNAVPQSAAEAVPQLLKHGVRHFRVELLEDTGTDAIGRTLDLYRRLLAGELSGKDVWRALQAANRVGVTRGTLEERRQSAGDPVMSRAVETRSAAGTLVFGTGNRKKAAELAVLAAPLGLTLLTLADFPAPLSVDETGASFAENAALKASQQAAHLGRWVLGDDSGLAVDALKGAPGIFSARYAGPAATDADNRSKLLAALAGVPTERRTAHFECHLALADPRGTIRATSAARCHGRIRETESGSGGFGYDPLFEIVEYHRTFGELSPEVKAVLSHRARAMFAILPALQALLAGGDWNADE